VGDGWGIITELSIGTEMFKHVGGVVSQGFVRRGIKQVNQWFKPAADLEK